MRIIIRKESSCWFCVFDSEHVCKEKDKSIVTLRFWREVVTLHCMRPFYFEQLYSKWWLPAALTYGERYKRRDIHVE